MHDSSTVMRGYRAQRDRPAHLQAHTPPQNKSPEPPPKTPQKSHVNPPPPLQSHKTRAPMGDFSPANLAYLPPPNHYNGISPTPSTHTPTPPAENPPGEEDNCAVTTLNATPYLNHRHFDADTFAIKSPALNNLEQKVLTGRGGNTSPLTHLDGIGYSNPFGWNRLQRKKPATRGGTSHVNSLDRATYSKFSLPGGGGGYPRPTQTKRPGSLPASLAIYSP